MQGEANARADGRQYNCSFQAMIKDWRAKWSQGTNGLTDPDFPFGWAQLNSDGSAQPIPYPPVNNKSGFEDPLGAWNAGFPSIRLAEQNTLALPNTFQAVIIDTPVASGSVHSPYKQPAGARLVRGALATAYDTQQPNPQITKATKSGTQITVTVGGTLDGTLKMQGTNSGFETLSLSKGQWQLATVSGINGNTVTLSGVPADAIALRYLFYSAPCGNAKPFQCPLYVTGLEPLGKLSGEMDSLPIGPHITML